MSKSHQRIAARHRGAARTAAVGLLTGACLALPFVSGGEDRSGRENAPTSELQRRTRREGLRPSPLEADPTDLATAYKDRYLSFSAPAAATAGVVEEAIRVRMVSLGGFAVPDPPYRWVGEPMEYADEGLGTFIAAPLQCDEPSPADFRDWGALGLVNVYGAEIVPGSEYEVQRVDIGCSSLADESCYSEPLTVRTGQWGDVVGPFAGGGSLQPDFGDIASLVDKFQGLPTAPTKSRTQLAHNSVRPDLPVDFSDIAADIDAFQGEGYPFSGPASGCPCLVNDLDCDSAGSLAQQHLELTPAAVCLIPEERVPLTVELVESDGARTPLDSSQFSLALEGVSGSVVEVQGKTVVRAFEAGDVGGYGQLTASFDGLADCARFAVATLSPADESALDDQLLNHDERLGDYAHARAKANDAAGAFETEHAKLETGQAATFLRHEAFVFSTSFGDLQGGNNNPPCSEIRRAFGPSPTTLSCDEGFYELLDLGGGKVFFILEPSAQVLLSNGSLGDCPDPTAPLSDPAGCSRIYVLVNVQIGQLAEPGVSEALVQEHLDVGPSPITAISASFIENQTAQVLYLQSPPLFCAAVYNAGGAIGGTTGACSGDRSGIATVGVGGSNVFWIFQGYTQPRENWINHQLTSIGVTVSTPQYRDLDEAETAVMNLLAALAKAELELAIRKHSALAQLKDFGGAPSAGTRTSTDYATEFLERYIDSLKEQGQEFVTDQIIDTIEDQLGLPLGEVSDQLDQLSGLVDQMKAAADLFNLLSNVDRPMSDTDRIRAVKQAFDLARQLGPGGPMVTAIAPFLDFYSLALGAIADALDVIDEMRKEQVLSTGDCSIIEAIIADPQRRADWQRACKLRQLLQAVRDP